MEEAEAQPGSAPKLVKPPWGRQAVSFVQSVCHQGEAAGAQLWKCLHSLGGSCGDRKRPCCSLMLLVVDGHGRADPGSLEGTNE